MKTIALHSAKDSCKAATRGIVCHNRLSVPHMDCEDRHYTSAMYRIVNIEDYDNYGTDKRAIHAVDCLLNSASNNYVFE